MTVNLISVSGQAYVSGNYVNIASIVADTYDRKGDIVWYDDFEHGLNRWDVSGSGTGYSADINHNTSVYGDNSCMLTCGSTNNMRASIGKYLSLREKNNLGLELSYAINSANLNYIDIQINKYTGMQHKLANFRIYTNGNAIYLKSDGSSGTLETDLDFIYNITEWYTLKIVVNFDENKLIRILHRKNSYELNSSLRILPSTFSSCIYVTIQAIGSLGNNPKVYIDRIYVTEDEP